MRLAENLQALAMVDPSLAAEVRSCAPDPSLQFMTARDGSVVPAVHDGARLTPLHSLYDPGRESRRAARILGTGGLHGFSRSGRRVPGHCRARTPRSLLRPGGRTAAFKPTGRSWSASPWLPCWLIRACGSLPAPAAYGQPCSPPGSQRSWGACAACPWLPGARATLPFSR